MLSVSFAAFELFEQFAKFGGNGLVDDTTIYFAQLASDPGTTRTVSSL
jgi:hypothetical protein